MILIIISRFIESFRVSVTHLFKPDHRRVRLDAQLRFNRAMGQVASFVPTGENISAASNSRSSHAQQAFQSIDHTLR
jgi:hypothetical protein